MVLSTSHTFLSSAAISSNCLPINLNYNDIHPTTSSTPLENYSWVIPLSLFYVPSGGIADT